MLVNAGLLPCCSPPEDRPPLLSTEANSSQREGYWFSEFHPSRAAQASSPPLLPTDPCFSQGFWERTMGLPTGSPESTFWQPAPPAASFPPSRLPIAALRNGSAIRKERKKGGIRQELPTSLSTTHLQLPLGARQDRDMQQHPHIMPRTCCLQPALPLIPLSQRQRTTNIQLSPWDWKHCHGTKSQREALCFKIPFL